MKEILVKRKKIIDNISFWERHESTFSLPYAIYLLYNTKNL